MNEQEQRELRNLFDIGLILKAIFSAFEIAGGIAVLFVSRMFVLHITELVTAGELNRDPDNLIGHTLVRLASDFAVHAHYILAAYLLLRGAIKLVLIILILRGVQRAYPLFIIALALFDWFETYRAVLTGNYFLGAVALYDTALILLTAYEYKRRHARAGYSS